MKSKASRAWFFGVFFSAICWVMGGALGPPAQAFHGSGLAGGSPSALHGTVFCAPSGTSGKAMQAVLRVIRRRLVRGFGDAHAQVARLGKTCIVVAFDPVTRRPSVRAALAAPGYVALTDAGWTPLAPNQRVRLSCLRLGPACPPGSKFSPTNLNAKPYPVLEIVVPGPYVKPGSAKVGRNRFGPTVTYALTGPGRVVWCSFTSSHIRGFTAIVLDNRVVVDSIIAAPVCNGQDGIAGLSSIQEAKRVAIFLNYGAHPIALHAAGTK